MRRATDYLLFPLSRSFTLLLLLVLPVVLAVITVVENLEVNPPQPYPAYLSLWFFALLAVVILNVCGVFFRPDIFRIQRWPNLFVHLGLVLVLLGGLLTHEFGLDGFVSLREGAGADSFRAKTPALILERGNLRRRVELGDPADEPGRTYADPEGQRFTAVSSLPTARRGPDGRPELDPTGDGPAALQLRPADGGEAVWLLEDSEPVSSGATRLRLTRERPLGFTMTLLAATEVKWPASSIPRSYYSRVRIDDPDRGLAREFLIETNDPLYYRGLRFYQSSMGGMGGGASSGFQVSRDPGVAWVTVGICMMGLGLLVVYALRFVRDPLAARRARRLAAEATEAVETADAAATPDARAPRETGGAS